jgi:hypothetical protein
LSKRLLLLKYNSKDAKLGDILKIRVVSTRNEIPDLNKNEKIIHLAFRPSNKDIFTVVQTCPGTQVIQVPSSYRKTISKSMEQYLQMSNIKLLMGNVWGHRKDINEYYTVSPTILEKVKELKSAGTPAEDILSQIRPTLKEDTELLEYIISTT